MAWRRKLILLKSISQVHSFNRNRCTVRGIKALITSLLHVHSLSFQFSHRPLGHTHWPKKDHYWSPIILSRPLKKSVQTIWKKPHASMIIELSQQVQTSFSQEHCVLWAYRHTGRQSCSQNLLQKLAVHFSLKTSRKRMDYFRSYFRGQHCPHHSVSYSLFENKAFSKPDTLNLIRELRV